ncbi:MAG: ribose-phosphate diphosphokinase [Methanoregula sp.]|jgi:ribose-phosphate pyrophosphokinase|nr:ribose-phosphate diphosphokinase [Methanoregula sp.]
MKVISTEHSQVLATRVARALDVKLVDVKYSRFPDGEHYLQTGELDDETIIIGSVTDNDALVQLLLLIDACSESRCHLVIPYMAYARQDKQFKKGEPLSARAVARALGSGVCDVTTVNIHDPTVLQHFSVPARNISIAKDIGSYLQALDLKNPLILAPDDGALKFAEGVASVGGWEFDYLEKTRISGNEVLMAPKQLCAASRSVVIVDDIISTGGTIATASGMLYHQDAQEVFAACVHGVFTEGAYGKLISKRIRDVICSDTIERACSRVSAADRIAHAMKNPRAP